MLAENPYKTKSALTRVREKIRYQQLDVDLRALPNTDVRKIAWLNVDKVSSVSNVHNALHPLPPGPKIMNSLASKIVKLRSLDLINRFSTFFKIYNLGYR